MADFRVLKKRAVFWIVGGSICSLPCWYYALSLGFTSVSAISGMVLGIFTIAAIYTWYSGLRIANPSAEGRGVGGVGASLRQAAYLRIAFSILGTFVLLLSRAQFNLLTYPELMSGVGTASAFDWIAKTFPWLGIEKLSPNPSFLWGNLNSLIPTALFTLSTGLLWSLHFIVLVFLVWFGKLMTAKLRR